ncbi:MAG: putative membrane protein YedE/YeeE [Bradymonadia bacterium]|jgi:uncharacterized membrane protein YedE/YeeE
MKLSTLTPALAGFIFAIGLGIAGMTDANKVISFLDLGGSWDPSLGFVMVGAIAVHMLLFRVIVRRPSPVYEGHFRIPTRQDIDLRLIGGAAIFGAGWGLGGFCPGPGIVSSVTGAAAAVVFVAAMLGGMISFAVADRLVRARIPEPGSHELGTGVLY